MTQPPDPTPSPEHTCPVCGIELRDPRSVRCWLCSRRTLSRNGCYKRMGNAMAKRMLERIGL